MKFVVNLPQGKTLSKIELENEMFDAEYVPGPLQNSQILPWKVFAKESKPSKNGLDFIPPTISQYLMLGKLMIFDNEDLMATS